MVCSGRPDAKTHVAQDSPMVMPSSITLRSLRLRETVMDYDPNDKFNYWRDEFWLDVALGLLFGLVICSSIFGTIRGM